MARLVIVGVSLLVALLGACGGEGTQIDVGLERDPDLAPAVVRQANAAESCLTDSDIQTERDPDRAFGVEDPFVKLNVNLQSKSFSKTYTGSLYFFDSSAEAAKARTAITLGTHNDARNKIIDNVLVTYSIVPEPNDVNAVEKCVP